MTTTGFAGGCVFVDKVCFSRYNFVRKFVKIVQINLRLGICIVFLRGSSILKAVKKWVQDHCSFFLILGKLLAGSLLILGIGFVLFTVLFILMYLM
jgi:hypothetical protein